MILNNFSCFLEMTVGENRFGEQYICFVCLSIRSSENNVLSMKFFSRTSSILSGPTTSGAGMISDLDSSLRWHRLFSCLHKLRQETVVSESPQTALLIYSLRTFGNG